MTETLLCFLEIQCKGICRISPMCSIRLVQAE